MSLVMACAAARTASSPATPTPPCFALAERDENTGRKDFTPSEAVAVGMTLDEFERPKAAERQREGGLRKRVVEQRTTNRRREGQNPGKGRAAVGLSGRTYERGSPVLAVSATGADGAEPGERVEVRFIE